MMRKHEAQGHGARSFSKLETGGRSASYSAMYASPARSTMISGALHGAAIVLVLLTTGVKTSPVKNTDHLILFTPLDVMRYEVTVPQADDPGGGGEGAARQGGGDRRHPPPGEAQAFPGANGESRECEPDSDSGAEHHRELGDRGSAIESGGVRRSARCHRTTFGGTGKGRRHRGWRRHGRGAGKGGGRGTGARRRDRGARRLPGIADGAGAAIQVGSGIQRGS